MSALLPAVEVGNQAVDTIALLPAVEVGNQVVGMRLLPLLSVEIGNQAVDLSSVCAHARPPAC